LIVLTDSVGEARFTGGGDLVELSRGEVGWRFEQPSPAWGLVLMRDGRKQSARPPVGSAKVVRGERSRLELRFETVVTEEGPSIPADITESWTVADGLLQGRLCVNRLPEGFALEAVILPDVVVGYGESPTSLIVPRETGLEIANAAEALFEGPQAPGEWEGSGEMQFYAWIEGRRGLYSDCRDEQGWFKSWRFASHGARRFRLSVRHLAPGDPEGGGRFELPYVVSLGAFEGGWYQAAGIYRRWALATRWSKRHREQRDNSLSRIACWVWNRGSILNVAPPAIEFSRRLGLPVALDWYWWHKHPYDVGYPEYFPPREGQERFEAAIRDLHEAKVFVHLYANGVICDMDLPAWAELAARGAALNERGQVRSFVFNPFIQHRMALMCGAAGEWHEVVLDLLRKAEALGVDGLYLDMISTSAGAAPCYSSSHGHARGGGCYSVDGFRRLLERARQVAPGLALTSESNLEYYLDLLDGQINCGVSLERFKGLIPPAIHPYAQPIPLFSAVYHGRCVCFGSYAAFHNAQAYDDLWPARFNPDPEGKIDWAERCPDQFALELARTVIFGCQPLVANLRLEHLHQRRYAEELDFLLRTCRLYHEHRDCLLWGDLLAPGRLECPCDRQTFLQRSIYTKPGRETYLTRLLPRVLHSEWQAPDGRCEAVLVNYSGQPADIRYSPPQGLAVGPSASGVQGGRAVGRLAPRSAAVIALEKA
jgi:hypothetical protein